MKKIYLDYAAATPMDDRVLAAMQPYFSQDFYNPSATYLAAKAVHTRVDEARARVAHWLGCRPSEIIFTAGGTEANNLAVYGVMDQYPDGNLVVSNIEHESVLKSAERYSVRYAAVSGDGVVDLAKLEKLIDKKTVLISIMYANNEIGSLQPIKQIAQLVKKVRNTREKAGDSRPLLLHTDACQAAAYLDLHVSRLGVDMLTLNSGKIYGPKQSGLLYVRGGTPLTPLITGGGQENGLRSGTENVAAIIGLATALDLAQTKRSDKSQRISHLRDDFFQQLESKIPQVIVNGSRTHRLPNNVHITLPGHDNERLMFALDERGIMCAVGSACSASSEEPSHVLKAIGLSDAAARSSLRFTLGAATTKADIDSTVRQLAALLPESQ